MSEYEYNGWANRATWNVALWLNEDWSVELEECDPKAVHDGDSMRRAFCEWIVELGIRQYYLEPIRGAEPSQFLTPDGERFDDADWDELFDELIRKPRLDRERDHGGAA